QDGRIVFKQFTKKSLDIDLRVSTAPLNHGEGVVMRILDKQKSTLPLTALGAYLLGSIPFGYLAARLKGIDLRTVGSGNIGATNALRVLGKPAGMAVFALDALKGWTAVALLPSAVAAGLGAPEPGTGLRIVAGICAGLGHNYTCWLRVSQTWAGQGAP
ncbi:MAG TPA: glycerol-3-phosphate acyltransferase, partial [Verrucomicrobiota bacterium]|nr:glycerol-3-phosphate acyltransferase [Verrucomicrobiota bacterium]